MAVLLAGGVVDADAPFATEQTIRPADGASSVVVADFDNDGQPDMAYTAYQADTVTVWQSSEPAYYVQIATGFDQAWCLAVGDVNGDGDVDLVAGKRSTTTDDDVVWFENPGNAGEPWPAHAVSGTYFSEVRSVEAADLDHDGDLDIALAGTYAEHGYISWFRNDGGSGTSWTLIDIVSDLEDARDVVAADLDRDGDLELIAADYDGDEILWLEQLAAGWSLHSLRTNFDGAECVAVGDLDDDGDPDVIAGSFLGDELRWFENRLDHDPIWIDHLVETGFDGVSSVSAADMDLDGDLDIVATASVEATVAWFESSSSWLRRELGQSFLGARSAVAVDRDGDGDLDVLAAALGDDSVAWWQNHSNHMAPAFSGYYSVLTGTNVMSVEMADMNRDGHLDIVAGAHNSSTDADVIVALWDGSPFEVHTVDIDLSGVRTVRVADIDGDSWPDIVAAAQTSGLVRWYRNLGDGSSYTEHAVATFASARGLEVGDLDCDGDLDVVATSATTDEVSCWFNNGDGSSFSAEQVIAAGMGDPATVRLADMNQDGDLDVVFGGMDGIISYRNNNSCSGTSWSPVVVASGFDNTTEVDVGDADGDGWQDIVVASSNADAISVLLHQGGTTWVERSLSLLPTWTAPTAARFGDLDHDGDLDVVAADHAADELTWFRNNGSGTFTRMAAIEDLNGAIALALGDWNADGRLDVTLAGEVADQVRLLPNSGGQVSVMSIVSSPPQIADGAREVFFTVLTAHATSWSSDLDMELRQMSLVFEDLGGGPLTSSQANALVDRVEVWAEIAGAGFDPGEDQLISIELSLDLDPDGIHQLSILHGSPRVEVGDVQTYYVVLEMTDDASSHADGLTIVHRQRSPMMRYWDYQFVPLRSIPWPAAEATVTFGGLLFADDFESGNTSAWSSVSP